MNKDIDVRDVRAGGEVEIVVRRGVLVGLVDAVGDAARVAARVAAWDAVGDAARVAARVAARALVVADGDMTENAARRLLNGSLSEAMADHRRYMRGPRSELSERMPLRCPHRKGQSSGGDR